MDSLQNSSTGSFVGDNGVMNTQQPNDTATTDEEKQNLNDVINSIQKTLGLLHQLHLTVSSFNSSSQLPLLQRLNSLVLELGNMVKSSEKCNIQVPIEVLNLIDDGKNPDDFTNDIINSCVAKNQMTKGKTDAFKAKAVYGALRGLETFSQLCAFDYATKSVQIYKAPWYIRTNRDLRTLAL